MYNTETTHITARRKILLFGEDKAGTKWQQLKRNEAMAESINGKI